MNRSLANPALHPIGLWVSFPLELFSAMSRVSELEQNIRSIFNIPRRHKQSREDHAAFVQSCSALDVIGDTEFAFHEYREANVTLGTGLTYIVAYGVLQAVFLQQDAIKHLALSLGLNFMLPQELREIRELRNDAIGHPTQRDIDKKKGIKSFHHISRSTLSFRGFQLLSTYSDKTDHEFRNINLLKIIDVQSAFAEKLLTDVLEQLRENETAHRGQYMNDKLSDIFHASVLIYLFEKVREGIRESTHREFGLSTFNTIIGYFDKFEEKLIERGEEESIEYVKLDLDYPVKKVREYFKGSAVVDQRAVEIFIEYIEQKFKKLKQIAEEIDNGYQEKVQL